MHETLSASAGPPTGQTGHPGGDAARKKQLKELYKQRKLVGGIYRIRNRETGRCYLAHSDDLNATRNWFRFCVELDNCTLPAIQADWKRFGPQGFELEEVDRLEQGEDQTREAFQRDLKALFEMWDEELAGEDRY